MSNISETKEENSDKINEPSECKIPKTEAHLDTNCINNQQEPESIKVKVIYKKEKHDVNVTSNQTIADFKKQLQELLGCPIQTFSRLFCSIFRFRCARFNAETHV